MNVSYKEECLPSSQVSLNISIFPEEIQKLYQKFLTQFSRKIKLGGFRQGKVPLNLIKKRYEQEIDQKFPPYLIDEAFQYVMTKVDSKPLNLAEPHLNLPKEKYSMEKEYHFSLVYDVYPHIILPTLDNININDLKIDSNEDDLNQELKQIQENLAELKDKEGNNAQIETNDIVSVDLVEKEQGEVKEETRKEGFTFTLHKTPNYYQLDDDLIGLHLEEEKEINKEYPQDYPYSELSGRNICLWIKVKNIKSQILPEIDDNLAQKYNQQYHSLEDLKKVIQDKINHNIENHTRSHRYNAYLQALMQKMDIVLPQSLINLELEQEWQRMSNQYRIDVKEMEEKMKSHGQSKQAIFEQWKPSITERLKMNLLQRELIQFYEIQVNESDMDQYLEDKAHSPSEKEKIKEFIHKNKLESSIKSDILYQKLYQKIIKNVKITNYQHQPYQSLLEKGHYE